MPPPYYLKVIFTSGVACMVAMMMNGGPSGALWTFLHKSWRFPLCIHHHRKGHHIGTSIWPHFADHGVFVIGETSRFLMVLPLLKWVCMPYLPQIFLILSQRPCVLGITIWPFVLLHWWWAGHLQCLVFSPISNLPEGPVKPFLHLVKSPPRVFTFGECLPEVIHFLVEKLRISYTLFGPYGWGC